MQLKTGHAHLSIVGMQGRLADEDDVLQSVSSEQQREEVSASLSQAEDWLYFDGADEGASAYRQHPHFPLRVH